IDVTVALDRGGEEGIDLRGGSRVTRDGHRVPTLGLDGRLHLAEPLDLARRQHHLRPAGSERTGDARADPPAGAGDHGDLPPEVDGGRLRVRFYHAEGSWEGGALTRFSSPRRSIWSASSSPGRTGHGPVHLARSCTRSEEHTSEL